MMDFAKFARKRSKDDPAARKGKAPTYLELSRNKGVSAEETNISSVVADINSNVSSEEKSAIADGGDLQQEGVTDYGAAPSSDIYDDDGLPITKTIDQYAAEKKIPIANQVDLKGHEKAVSVISFEPAGNRLVTGSVDYTVKLFDFGGMDSRQRSFHSFEPEQNHLITGISHSPSGDRFVVTTGSAQPVVYERNGKDIVIKFARGDMYLRDLANTKGHTMETTDCMWHPMEKNLILTSSADGSLRLWDLMGQARFGNLVNQHVLKIRGSTGQTRTGATCCAFSPSGARIAGGASDGTIHIWHSRKSYGPPDMLLRQPSGANWGETTRLSIATDNRTLAARYNAGFVALWDISSMTTARAPLKVFGGLPNDYYSANVDFSPDMKLLCCGTSPMKVASPTVGGDSIVTSSSSNSGSSSCSNSHAVAGVSKSRLYFFEVQGESTAPVLHIAIADDATVITVRWQPQTNQIICGLSSGDIRVLYDTTLSRKGVLLSVTRAPKREKDPTDFAAIGEIYAPLALKMYRTDRRDEAEKKKRMLLRDPVVAKIPEKPTASGPGTRPNNSFFYTKYVMQQRGVDNTRLEDPREALMRLAQEAEQDPKYTGRAYQTSDPRKQLHSQTFEEEQSDFKKRQKTL